MDCVRLQLWEGDVNAGEGARWAYPSADEYSCGVKAVVSCPGCGRPTSIRTHEVNDDGTVHPSMVCSLEGCAFHDWIWLMKWQPLTAHRIEALRAEREKMDSAPDPHLALLRDAEEALMKAGRYLSPDTREGTASDALAAITATVTRIRSALEADTKETG